MSIIEQLKTKVNRDDGARMPSIKKIHELLTERSINHEFRESSNTVEHKSKGRMWVNRRYEGKRGYKIQILIPEKLVKEYGYLATLDTSDSYYSVNAPRYARMILILIGEKCI